MGLANLTYCGDGERSSKNHGPYGAAEFEFCLAVEVVGLIHGRLLLSRVVIVALAFDMGVALSRFRGGSVSCSGLGVSGAYARLKTMTLLETRVGPSLKTPLCSMKREV